MSARELCQETFLKYFGILFFINLECSSNTSPPPVNGYKNGTYVPSPWILAMLEDSNSDPFHSRLPLPARVESLRLSVSILDVFAELNFHFF